MWDKGPQRRLAMQSVNKVKAEKLHQATGDYQIKHQQTLDINQKDISNPIYSIPQDTNHQQNSYGTPFELI